MSGQLIHPKYRPDINGLRALAILAVLIFHAFPTLLPGGFVGVDVFFVISGFLISTIIFQNLQNGSFSFLDFYARRVRRIFPALLLVLVSCLVLGWFSLLGNEYAQLGKHIAAGAGFVSNLALWNESGYFDTASSTKPLLHLWSLGIEEQFYLVWPLLLWLAWKRRLGLMATTAVVLALSFGLNLYAVGHDTVAAYYSPLGRFWELLVGALLAFKLSAAPAGAKPAHPDLLATLGLLLVAISLAVLDPQSAFPGWWALLPVLGTALLIAAGDAAWINQRLLSHRAMVWIGLISYPLYLWHWPLLSFAEILAGRVPAPEYRVLCLLAAFVLAWLTYLVIERPYRPKTYRLHRVLYLTVPMVLVGLLGFDVFHRDGLSFRHEQLSAAKPADAQSVGFTSQGVSTTKEVGDDACNDRVVRHTPKVDAFCHLAGTAPYLAVIGDSHANHLASGLRASADDKLRQYLVVGTAGGCHPALQGGQSSNCDDQAQANLELIQQFPSIRYVVLSAATSAIQASTEAQYRQLLQGYLRTIAQLQSMGKTVVYVVDTPGFETSPAACAPNPLPLRAKYQHTEGLCQSLPTANTVPRDHYNRFVQDLQSQAPTLRLVDAYSLFCDTSSCKVLDDGTLLFKDSNHLTDYGAKLLVDKIGAQLRTL